LLSIAYNTILVAYYIKIVALKMTSFPIIIIYRVKAVSFKMTGFTAAVIKSKSFLKRTIGIYITGRQIKMAF
jgi:hypothetical protein